MSAIPSHTNDPVCPLCEYKLERVHPFLANWFRAIKDEYPDVHVSWGYRDQASQDQAVAEKLSRDPWPTSLHNQDPSKAIDLFQINEQGKGVWNTSFMRMIADQNSKNGIKVSWGGNYPGDFKDCDHFYLPKF